MKGRMKSIAVVLGQLRVTYDIDPKDMTFMLLNSR